MSLILDYTDTQRRYRQDISNINKVKLSNRIVLLKYIIVIYISIYILLYFTNSQPHLSPHFVPQKAVVCFTPQFVLGSYVSMVPSRNIYPQYRKLLGLPGKSTLQDEQHLKQKYLSNSNRNHKASTLAATLTLHAATMVY